MIDWLQHIYNRLSAFIEAAVMAASTAIQEAESITWTTTLKTLQKEYSEWERRFGMSEKYLKCLRPIYAYRYGCAYVVWGDCAAPKIQYESCKCYMNEDKNYMRWKHE